MTRIDSIPIDVAATLRELHALGWRFTWHVSEARQGQVTRRLEVSTVVGLLPGLAAREMLDSRRAEIETFLAMRLSGLAPGLYEVDPTSLR